MFENTKYSIRLTDIPISLQIDPAMAEFEAAEDAAEDDGMALPTRQNDEFRPFIRR